MDRNYKEIDMKTWKRAAHCQVFRNYAQPQYGVSFELDITHFLPEVRKAGFSFTFATIYLAAKCANAVEEFRYRFLEGKVVLFDTVGTSFTYLDRETELFKVVRVDMTDTMAEYVDVARKTVQNQKTYFPTDAMGNDIFQFSPMPFIPFTHISHTDSGKKDTATPLFDWGKYFERDGRILLPFSVQVHHSFVDGIHLGRLFDSLQASLNAFEAAREL